MHGVDVLKTVTENPRRAEDIDDLWASVSQFVLDRTKNQQSIPDDIYKNEDFVYGFLANTSEQVAYLVDIEGRMVSLAEDREKFAMVITDISHAVMELMAASRQEFPKVWQKIDELVELFGGNDDIRETVLRMVDENKSGREVGDFMTEHQGFDEEF